MKPILIAVLLATLGCDSIGIVGNPDGSTDASTDPDAASDGPTAVPYLTEYEKGECMERVCPPDDPGAEFLEANWAGVTEPDCVKVTHRCAPMNCCTTLSPRIDHIGTTIYIHERETGEECWCTCHYHPRYTICGLASGSWLIAIEEAGLSSRVSIP